MSIISVINFLFGIALFLYGLNLMSEHLKKITGSKAEVYLYKLTDNPLKGMFIGTATTTLIQSSSAVSAMAVNLCESGIMRLKQAIPIILGSILGTSITGWIVAYSTTDTSKVFTRFFSVSALSAVFAVVGIVMKLFVKQHNIKRFGEILLGFSILMLGIHMITQAVTPLKNNLELLTLLKTIRHPMISFFVGVVVSAVLQSASASVGILQTVSLSGFITLGATLPMLAGIGIGASLPVLIAAVGKNMEAKRCAFSYLCANTGGAVVFLALYFIIYAFFSNKYESILLNPLTIATANTVYRFIIVFVWLPFIGVLERISRGCIKGKNKTFQKKYRFNNE